MNRKALWLLLAAAISASLASAQGAGEAAPPLHITLSEAVQLALKHNHMVRIAGYQIDEKQHAKEAARSGYFPHVTNESTIVKVTDTQFIQIAAGSLGTVTNTPIPEQSVTLNQGSRTIATSGTGLVQPLTQLFTSGCE